MRGGGRPAGRPVRPLDSGQEAHLERLRVLRAALDVAEAERERLLRERQALVLKGYELGITTTALAAATGLSQPRITQFKTRWRRSER